MSEISTTTVVTTTPLVTVVSSRMSSPSSVTMAPSLTRLPATLVQCDVVLPPPLTPSCPWGVIGLASVPQQQPPSLLYLQAYANYAMGSPQVGFFPRVEPATILYIICLVSVPVSAFYFQVPYWMSYSPLGVQPLGFALLQPLEFTCGRHMCNLLIISPCQVCTEWLLPSLPWVGEPSAAQLAVLQPSHLYGGAYSFGGLAESHLIPPSSLQGGEGFSFPG